MGIYSKVFISIFFGIGVGLNSEYCFANFFSQLSSDQRKQVLEGKPIVHFQDVADAIWPKSRVIQKVSATPEEVAAVITDYKRQKEYIYRVVESTPTGSPGPGVAWVDYRMELPSIITSFFDSRYQLLQRIRYLSESQTYELTWALSQSKSIKTVEGSAWIEPLSENESLIIYDNLVDPIMNNFVLRSYPVLNSVKRGAKKVLQSIIDRVELEKNTQQSLLKQQVEALRLELSQH